MSNIKLNNCQKRFTINDDENKVIFINTTDMQILKRLKKAEPEMRKLANECAKLNEYTSVDDAIELLSKCDAEVRKNIDFIFNSNIADIVFGNTNCISFCDGQPLFMNFMDAVLPEIEKDIAEEQNKSSKRISKYTSQVKK